MKKLFLKCEYFMSLILVYTIPPAFVKPCGVQIYREILDSIHKIGKTACIPEKSAV